MHIILDFLDYSSQTILVSIAGVLLVSTLPFWVLRFSHYHIDPLLWISCQLGFFLIHFGFSYSSALLVIISVEKLFALYFPFETKTICTVKIARRVSLVTGVLFAGFNAHFFYTGKKKSTEQGTYCTYGGPEKYLIIVLNIFGALYSYVPFVIIMLANFAIIYKFIKATLKTTRGRTESTNQALSKSATRGTGMLLTVSFAFIILTGPISIIHIWKEVPVLVKDIALVLHYLNHGINGILYCVAGTRFRNELKKMFVCRKDNHQQSFTRTTVLSSKSEST